MREKGNEKEREEKRRGKRKGEKREKDFNTIYDLSIIFGFSLPLFLIDLRFLLLLD